MNPFFSSSGINCPGEINPFSGLIHLTSASEPIILPVCNIHLGCAPKIEKAFAAEFTDALPTADALLDNKAVAKNEQRKVQKALITEVATLKEALSKAQIDPEQLAEDNYMDDVSDAVSGNMGDITDDAASETELTGNSDINGQSALCDVFLRMKPERASLVTDQMIDGQKCLIIPVEDDDDIDLNGIKL